jgi:hypothetical protein
MTQDARDQVRGRALGAILRNALLSWETVLTAGLAIGLTVLSPTPFDWWQPWFWLAGGGLAEAAFIISRLTDPTLATEAVTREFEQKFDLGDIRSGVSRQRLQSALEYRRNMLKLMDQKGGAMRASLKQTIDDVNDWIGHMFNLARAIDSFDANDLVERDRKMVPQQITKTKQRIDLERDPVVKQDLQQQLAQLQQQLTNLEATANGVKRAEIQLESTLSSLGTIYAQMSLLGAKEVDSAKAQRLRLEIQDEVASLQDTIDAMTEVQSQRLQMR